MCGVFFTRDETRVELLLASLKHRGPDGQSVSKRVVSKRSHYIGHTRLSIVDLETGGQPFLDKERITAFNGEIFNYRDLGQGPEVSVLAERFGVRGLSGLSGYFAGVQLDSSREQLLMARDPLGVMPLYYCKTTKEVCSEPDKLLRPKALPPGHLGVLNLKTDRLKIVPFYHQHSRTSQFKKSVAAELWLQAVHRVASHSEVGFSLALSGGLDSGLLAIALKELGLTPDACFTAYLNKESVELRRAEDLASKLGFPHRALDLREADWGLVKEHYKKTYNASRNLRNPIKLRGFFRQYAVAQSAKSKVLLCGEGADEIDCGYPSHRVARDLVKKRLSVFNSQPFMTLDRVNQAGMAFSKEYRVPYLDLEFASYMMSVNPKPGKLHLRELAAHFGIHSQQEKYSDEDSRLVPFCMEVMSDSHSTLQR